MVAAGQYDAFISYGHAGDRDLSEALQLGLAAPMRGIGKEDLEAAAAKVRERLADGPLRRASVSTPSAS